MFFLYGVKPNNCDLTEVSPKKIVASTLRKGVRLFASTMPYKD
jgi:hypothetical protein